MRYHILLDINEPYTRKVIWTALSHPVRAPYFVVQLGPGYGMDPVPMANVLQYPPLPLTNYQTNNNTTKYIRSPPHNYYFQWAEYERVDWTAVLQGYHGASSYCIRKGLARKAQLTEYTNRYIRKRHSSGGGCRLASAIPTPTIVLETWSAWENEEHHGSGAALSRTHLSSLMVVVSSTPVALVTEVVSTPLAEGVSIMQHPETLVDAAAAAASASSSHVNGVDVRQRLNECLRPARVAMQQAEAEYQQQKQEQQQLEGISHPSRYNRHEEGPVWILKGSTVNKGEGIYIVHVFEEVLDHCWDEPNIREWVLQPYIAHALLLQKRKFHLRVYVLATHAIQVYVCYDILVLLSAIPYQRHNTQNLQSHITNTVFQHSLGVGSGHNNFREEDCVQLWHNIGPVLVQDGTCANQQEAERRIEQVWDEIKAITAELFDAYKSEFNVFTPLEGCFEHYGLDFLIDDQWQVYLLEVNPGPDFKQTGQQLSSVVGRLMESTIDAFFFQHDFMHGGSHGDDDDEEEEDETKSNNGNVAADVVGNLVRVYSARCRGSRGTSVSGVSMRVS